MQYSPVIKQATGPGPQPREVLRASFRRWSASRLPSALGRASVAAVLSAALCFGTAWATENGPILFAPSAEDLRPLPSNGTPSSSPGLTPAPSPGDASPPSVPAMSPAPVPSPGQGGWVRAGTARSHGSYTENRGPDSLPSATYSGGTPPQAVSAPPLPGMFSGAARPLHNPTAVTSPQYQGGFSPGGSSANVPYPTAGPQPGLGPYAAGRPGAYAVPKQEPKKGWFGLPKLDLGKLFRRTPPPNPAYADVAAPPAGRRQSILPNTNAWRGSGTADVPGRDFPPTPGATTSTTIRRPEWNPQDPLRSADRTAGTNFAGTNAPPSASGSFTGPAGGNFGNATPAAGPRWDPQSPYATPYAVPPQSNSAWAPRELPLTALPPQTAGTAAAPLTAPREGTSRMRIASPAPYGGPTGTLFGGPGVAPSAAPSPEAGFFGKPTFWDRVKVWWKDVTSPRRDHPRAALLPPSQAWNRLEDRLRPRPQLPGQDPFTAQRGGPFAVDSAPWGAASTMQGRNYSPALLPPPRPQLPGSIPRW